MAVRSQCFIGMILMFSLITGCAAQSESKQVIHGVEVTSGKLRVQVMSTGCTQADSFILQWQQNTVLLKRIKPDNCRRMPFKKWLSFNLPANVETVKIQNSFGQ